MRGKTLLVFFFFLSFFLFNKKCLVVSRWGQSVTDLRECGERRRGERGARVWEEKGTVVGQVDRDVSTASVISWRLGPASEGGKRRVEGEAVRGRGKRGGVGWGLKDQQHSDRNSRDHPNNSTRDWQGGRGRGWGVKARGESWSSVTHYGWWLTRRMSSSSLSAVHHKDGMEIGEPAIDTTAYLCPVYRV